MKRTIIELLLLAFTNANASTYLCQSLVLNVSQPREQISSIYIKKTGVRIQSKGEIMSIKGDKYSLEQSGDRFILKTLNYATLMQGSIKFIQILGNCRLI